MFERQLDRAVIIILASAAAGSRPRATDQTASSFASFTLQTTRELSPTHLPTRPLPGLTPNPVPTSAPGTTGESTLYLANLHAINATTAWGTTMIPTSNYGYWFTMLLRTTDGGANWLELTR